MNAHVFCCCGHDVGCHGSTGRCLLQVADGSECPCTESRPETASVGDTVYRLYPMAVELPTPSVSVEHADDSAAQIHQAASEAQYEADHRASNATDVTVTAEEFDRNPKAVYDASKKGPVTVLDSKGQPSMTVVQPSGQDPSDASPAPRKAGINEPCRLACADCGTYCDCVRAEPRSNEANVGPCDARFRAHSAIPSTFVCGLRSGHMGMHESKEGVAFQNQNDATACVAAKCRENIHEPPCPKADPAELALYNESQQRHVTYLRGLLRKAIEHLDAMPEKHRPGLYAMDNLRQGLRVGDEPRTDKATSAEEVRNAALQEAEDAIKAIRFENGIMGVGADYAANVINGLRSAPARDLDYPKGGALGEIERMIQTEDWPEAHVALRELARRLGGT